MIDIDVASRTISVGDVVEGVTSWQLSNNNSIPKSLTVSLGWRTEGRGNKNEGTVQALRLDADDLRSHFSQRLPFSFRIPDDAPITYNGALIRVIWEVKAVLKMPGLFRRPQMEQCLLEVIPRSIR